MVKSPRAMLKDKKTHICMSKIQNIFDGYTTPPLDPPRTALRLPARLSGWLNDDVRCVKSYAIHQKTRCRYHEHSLRTSVACTNSIGS